jgi:hypothetical protein
MVLASIACATALAACPGPTYIVQQYPGPVRPRETIAILRINGNDVVQLVLLDDDDMATPIADDARLHLELLPGRHRLRVQRTNQPHALVETLAFEAEAGRVYRVVYVGDEPRIFEVDRESDKTGRDVTITPTAPGTPIAPPPPVAPPPPPAPPAADDAGVAL